MMLYNQKLVVKIRKAQSCLRWASGTTRIVPRGELPAAAYKPEIVENRYDEWEREGKFKRENSCGKTNFSMVLPPPNITGNLHLGHALACTIQDVIVRRQRSLGHNVLWLPGTDHAGIATQNVVEKFLHAQGLDKYDLGREEFIKEVWKFKEKHGNRICQQLRKLGCSLDWTRQAFTMSPKHSNSVNHAFIQLFERNLIYRKEALVNWCHTLKSTISDIEVDQLHVNGPTFLSIPSAKKAVKFGQLYQYGYPVVDSKDEFVVVCTTMPETLLGDTAVAVHPDDPRYSHLRGKRVVHPFLDKTLPIIFDDFVDMEFGTGAVKITPAHSKLDYEVARDHHLPLIQVITENGTMQNAGEFSNMNKFECREEIVSKLIDMGLLKCIKPHNMLLPICSRTGDPVDYLLKEQWFVKCSEMNARARKVVETGKLKIMPEKFVKQWLDWSHADRDWCISRQLWWGHQIPAYKCSRGQESVWVAAADENKAKYQAAKRLKCLPDGVKAVRDQDVLDTWFSSGIYPFAALGWPNQHYNQDFAEYYPLSLMATGHDILGFWVHRMVMLGQELTGKLPFDKVLLHGVICDSKGAKMSKSKGNVIDPMDVIKGIKLEELHQKTAEMQKMGILSIDEYQNAIKYQKANFHNTNGILDCGVDALRFTLLSNDVQSHYVSFDLAACHANKLFCNKIWQSVKYLQLTFDKLIPCSEEITRNDLTLFDRWILSRMVHMVEACNIAFQDNDFHLATTAIKTFIHNEFCDLYLESTKPSFVNSYKKACYAHAHTLSAALHVSLRCLAPFMVYLTDVLIPKIPSFHNNIIHNYKDERKKQFDFPETKDFEVWRNYGIEKRADKFLDCIDLIRELRGIYNISNKLRPKITIISEDDTLLHDLEANKTAFRNMVRCDTIEYIVHKDKKYVTTALDTETSVYVEMPAENVDQRIQYAKVTLKKRAQKLEETCARIEAKIKNKKYIQNVPEKTRQMEKEKLMSKRKQLEQLQRLIQ